MRKSERILFENSPAEYFTDAYPIGNGKLGGMIWGGTENFRIGLNLDELWCGGECEPFDAWNIEDYKEARRLAMAGKFGEASDYLSKKYAKFNAMAYLTLGDIIIEMPKGEYTDYRRELDLYDGLASVDYKLADNGISVRSFASYPDKIIATRIEAAAKSDFRITLKSPLKNTAVADGGVVTLSGVCNERSHYHRDRNTFPDSRLGKECVNFTAKMSVKTDGTLTSEGGSISVVGATYSEILFTAVSSYLDGYAFKNPNYESEADEQIKRALTKTFDEIFATHKADINALFDRMDIALGEVCTDDKPTSQRIDEFDIERDGDLISLVFNFGRYLLISGSREGSRALNLQGIWNPHMEAPWSSNYTTNINAQMNYWPALPTGLTELLGPFEEEIRLIARNGKQAAKKLFGAGGITSCHNSDIFGFATPVAGWTQWSFFPLAIDWMMRELYNKYEYTLDKEYLRSVYQLFSDGAEFILDMLIDDGEYLIFSPGTSPENSFVYEEDDSTVADGDSPVVYPSTNSNESNTGGSPEGKRLSDAAKSSEMFASIIRDTINRFIESSEILGIESELLERARAAKPRLLPTLITDDGRIAEWYIGDGKNNPPEYDVHHRHISHLYALYPAREITVNSGALKDAAVKSLDVRGDASTGWSLGWKMNCRARLCDGDAMTRLFKLFFNHVHSSITKADRPGGVYSNLFCAHPPFQIDGNFAFTAAVCEMLVQDIDGEIVALPALPKEIKSGCARGIRLRGNRMVDLAFKDGKLTEFKIY